MDHLREILREKNWEIYIFSLRGGRFGMNATHFVRHQTSARFGDGDFWASWQSWHQRAQQSHKCRQSWGGETFYSTSWVRRTRDARLHFGSGVSVLLGRFRASELEHKFHVIQRRRRRDVRWDLISWRLSSHYLRFRNLNALDRCDVFHLGRPHMTDQ